ncbi:MAG: hypothetical protein LBG79_08220 [Spirochaetaceae bacterium]|jgi:hypothetical protein|nr:hypothetical protein [Spirochaetaceae bacterium]GMO14589.1 MAG: hypothetical protein Pg6A_00100 [Termitinemataceae bacterium]
MAVKQSFFEKLKKIPSKIAAFFVNMGESGYFAIWIGVFFVSAALLWGITSNIRLRGLAEQVNTILETSGEKSRLNKALRSFGLSGTASQSGTWFLTTDNKLAVIWNIPADGIFASYLTLFDDETQIEKIVPLSVTAKSFAARSSNGIPQLWMDRITRSARIIQGGRS